MASPLNARLQLLELGNRLCHFDSDGGGTIVRTFYCEPYTAHKRVLIALRGTIKPSDPDNLNSAWERVKPHNDPLFPWFYCCDAEATPAHAAAVRGSAPKGFVNDPGADDPVTGQLPAIRAAMDVFDDFDGAAAIDNLTVSEVASGGPEYIADDDSQPTNAGDSIPIRTFNSRGTCGAWIRATYKPLFFPVGLPATPEYRGIAYGDQFDFVNPTWQPQTTKLQTGRSLQFWSPGFGVEGNAATLHGGLVDTFEVPEVTWRFTVKRLMVPFIPKLTIAAFSNKISSGYREMGAEGFPPGTIRMETPEVETVRGPCGNIWHNLTFNFLVRQLYDEYYAHDAQAYVKGWVDWNHHYGVPTAGPGEAGLLAGILPGLMLNQRSCYYPVVWNGGLFQLQAGQNHPLYLTDSDVDMGLIGGGALVKSLFDAPFHAGFVTGQ